ncbi:lipocalin family protein [Candidatus Bipolaricaulota bacterium]|nr:lipocalin family protein [Candidatus Bipolaricaulota bacterium]MBS3791614.1 lipocalin family protein [Candidatus Bipolaricaulota bacterium]
MKWFLVELVILPALLTLGMNTGSSDIPKTVDEQDVNKYLGKWYAIASVVKFFNRNCAHGNRAKYSLRGDGKIDLVNSCYTKNGRKNQVHGVA